MPPMVGYDPLYERLESDLLARYLRAGTTAIDIGANTGHYTLLAARYVSSTGRVLSVEPSPTNFPRLCQNVWANGFRNVTLLSAAVADKSSVAPLYLDGGCGGDDRLCQYPGEDRQCVYVPTLSLDEIIIRLPQFANGVEFIKIDVQGQEINVLRGATRLLASNPDNILLVEYSPYDLRMAGSSGTELLEHLFGLDCLIAICQDDNGTARWGALSPGQPLLVRPEQERMVVNLLCLRGRYKNI